MKKSNMTAATLRIILSTAVILLIGLSAAGFYFGQDRLRTFATTVSQKVADSQASGTDIQSLKKLEASLLERQGVIAKASTINASSIDFQKVIIQDIDKYATYAGVTVSNYSFPTVAAPTTTPTGTTTPAAAPISGAKSVTITISSPLSYEKLMKFMSAIEGNLPKMQISKVNIGRATSGDSSSVTTEQLTIEVYTQ